jgi:SNF2 family DNA or RNA helicase
MKIKFNVTKDRVLFIHDTAAEYKALIEFPAFLREGPYFYAPAKIHVIFNIINRLKLAFKKIAVDKDVHDFMNLPVKLNPIPESFQYITKPMDFQEIALRFMYTMGSGGILLEPGMGKSKVVLDFIALMQFNRSLILCPKPLTFVWEDEIRVHRPDLSIHVFESTDWDVEWEKAKDKQVVVMNYTKASLMKEQLAKVKFDFIHLDEFLIKDPTSARTLDITKLSYNIPYRCGGSGTLINNSVLDVFAPVRYLEPSLVGTTFSKFLRRHTVRNQRDIHQIVAYQKKDEARSILDTCCIVMTKAEWLKLPNKTVHDIIVQPSLQQEEFYKGLSKNYAAQIDGEWVTIDNALVMMAKLSQVSNGFVYISDKKDDDADIIELLAVEEKKPRKKSPRVTKFFDEQPKIVAMLDLIKNTTKQKRAIIWYNSNAEYTLISQALDVEGLTYRAIKGGTKNLGSVVREFNTNPNIQFLLAQAKTLNYGVTVMGTTLEKMENSEIEFVPGVDPSVHTQIFYSCNFSLEVYLQQMDRVHRLGQTEDCSYYRIFMDTSVERQIKKALEDKMDVRVEMLIDIAESLKGESNE